MAMSAEPGRVQAGQAVKEQSDSELTRDQFKPVNINRKSSSEWTACCWGRGSGDSGL